MTPFLVLARRELRADVKRGFRGFRIFLACLALGVATIAAAGELTVAVQAGIDADSRSLLGGDITISQSYHALDADVRLWLEDRGKLTQRAEMRAMVKAANGERSLVELKAVDGAYPLYGELRTEPQDIDLSASHEGAFPALADPGLIERLQVKQGDIVELGTARLRVAGAILAEPDKVASPFLLGPRLMISHQALEASGLLMPGSIVRHIAGVALHPDRGAIATMKELEQRFKGAVWRIRSFDEAAPGLKRFLDNLSLFLTLTGLTGLLVGGVGVANAVKSHLETRAQTIAILKCLGAENGLVFAVYGLEVMALAAVGIVLGLVLGLLIPLAAQDLVNDSLPVRMVTGIYPLPLLKAALAGFLVALAFGIVPLAVVRSTSPASAMRAQIVKLALKHRLSALALAAPPALALAVLVVQTSTDRSLALWFVAIATLSLVLFRLLAWLLARLARHFSRHAQGAGLRLALGQLFRPGSPAPSVVVSLGIGLAVLTTLAQIEANLRNQIESRLPEEAPAFFFIDIQPDQKQAFLEAASREQARDIQLAPMIRGRLVSVNGETLSIHTVAPQARWALEGDRGFSSAERMPEKTHLVKGRWWPEDYRGPALVSVDARLAQGLGIGIGSRIGIDVLGRSIEAEVSSLREIDWSAASMNFAFLFSPGVLEGAPHTLLATARADPNLESAIERSVTDALPNVSAIRVRQALDQIKGVLEGAGAALAVMATATLPAGGLVLAGAVAASFRRRVYEAVVLKVLGAESGMLFRAYLLEFLLLGLATAILAGLIGTLAAFGILSELMRMEWRFLPATSVALLIFGLLVTLMAGHLVTAKALAAKAAPYLRNE